jgi:hypothetical protein
MEAKKVIPQVYINDVGRGKLQQENKINWFFSGYRKHFAKDESHDSSKWPYHDVFLMLWRPSLAALL